MVIISVLADLAMSRNDNSANKMADSRIAPPKTSDFLY